MAPTAGAGAGPVKPGASRVGGRSPGTWVAFPGSLVGSWRGSGAAGTQSGTHGMLTSNFLKPEIT